MVASRFPPPSVGGGPQIALYPPQHSSQPPPPMSLPLPPPPPHPAPPPVYHKHNGNSNGSRSGNSHRKFPKHNKNSFDHKQHPLPLPPGPWAPFPTPQGYQQPPFPPPPSHPSGYDTYGRPLPPAALGPPQQQFSLPPIPYHGQPYDGQYAVPPPMGSGPPIPSSPAFAIPPYPAGPPLPHPPHLPSTTYDQAPPYPPYVPGSPAVPAGPPFPQGKSGGNYNNWRNNKRNGNGHGGQYNNRGGRDGPGRGRGGSRQFNNAGSRSAAPDQGTRSAASEEGAKPDGTATGSTKNYSPEKSPVSVPADSVSAASVASDSGKAVTKDETPVRKLLPPATGCPAKPPTPISMTRPGAMGGRMKGAFTKPDRELLPNHSPPGGRSGPDHTDLYGAHKRGWKGGPSMPREDERDLKRARPSPAHGSPMGQFNPLTGPVVTSPSPYTGMKWQNGPGDKTYPSPSPRTGPPPWSGHPPNRVLHYGSPDRDTTIDTARTDSGYGSGSHGGNGRETSIPSSQERPVVGSTLASLPLASSLPRRPPSSHGHSTASHSPAKLLSQTPPPPSQHTRSSSPPRSHSYRSSRSSSPLDDLELAMLGMVRPEGGNGDDDNNSDGSSRSHGRRKSVKSGKGDVKKRRPKVAAAYSRRW